MELGLHTASIKRGSVSASFSKDVIPLETRFPARTGPILSIQAVSMECASGEEQMGRGRR